jgi:hypothetical protein
MQAFDVRRQSGVDLPQRLRRHRPARAGLADPGEWHAQFHEPPDAYETG